MSNLNVYMPFTSQSIAMLLITRPDRAALCLGLVVRVQPAFQGHLVWLRTSIGMKTTWPISATTGSLGLLMITALCSDHLDLFSPKAQAHSASSEAAVAVGSYS